MQTGIDLKDGQNGPPDAPILQVMPWPVYSQMTRCDLRAIYEFLRVIPPYDRGMYTSSAVTSPSVPPIPQAGGGCLACPLHLKSQCDQLATAGLGRTPLLLQNLA
jgi:hypothetical protein